KRRAPASTRLQHGKAESGLSVAVAVVQHVAHPRVVEDMGILDGFAVPAGSRYADARGIVVAHPGSAVGRLRVADAIRGASIRVPHPVPAVFLQHARPRKSVLDAGAKIQRDAIALLPPHAVTRFR